MDNSNQDQENGAKSPDDKEKETKYRIYSFDKALRTTTNKNYTKDDEELDEANRLGCCKRTMLYCTGGAAF